MFIRKITFTLKGEAIVRIPKMMVRQMKLKTDDIIISREKNMVVIQGASQNLARLAELRLLDRKRLKEYGKTT